ncbi:MAG: hypothetical protein ACQEP5_08365 [Actinomycetota bacterium]
MPDEKKNLYLFEAIQLRDEYDSRIRLLEKLTDSQDKSDRLFGSGEQNEPAEDFNLREAEEKLKKLQLKRLKLNQAIQLANFSCQIEYGGEKISIAEALEVRKSLLAEKETLLQKAIKSAYSTIIHKEERDIVRRPVYPFKQTVEEYGNNLKKLRDIINRIHIANYRSKVNFKEH